MGDVVGDRLGEGAVVPSEGGMDVDTPRESVEAVGEEGARMAERNFGTGRTQSRGEGPVGRRKTVVADVVGGLK
ncbi:hypothetical protein MLD38_019544 [Melastoma candidum]|uniref:Uncharacterized protein n=1 Tax=Melastoma candidum TaxID=119954 RepID=A0ACB9QXB9_9MYRT|nr:hypothetical protein MLD38_019544 [Melastoma candidum]